VLEYDSPEWWLRKLQNQHVRRLPDLNRLNDYYEGHHRIPFASPKFRQMWGGIFNGFSDNWCGTVVAAAEERLDVVGFRFGSQEEADADIWEFWQANNMDGDSQLAHVDALVYAESYAFVWPDESVPGGVRISPESPTQVIVAPDSANRRKIRAAAKFYTDDDGHQVAYVHLPDGLYRWYSKERTDALDQWNENTWIPEDREGTEDPDFQPQPIAGIVPVAVLPNRGRLTRPPRSEIADILPLQDAINKTFIDLLIASDQSAKSQRYVENWNPEYDENSGQPKPPPWRQDDPIWFAPPPDDEGASVRFGQFQGSDLKGHIAALELGVNHVAAISRTPPHYLSPSADRLSGESIKSSESGLVSKVRRKQVSLGEGWEQAIRLLLRMQGDERADFVSAETVWRDPEIRSDAEMADAAMKRQSIGVPNRQLQQDIGYTPVQISRFDSMRTEDTLFVSAAEDSEVAREAAEAIQKVVAGVQAGILSTEEARAIANRAGAQLTGVPPTPPTAPAVP